MTEGFRMVLRRYGMAFALAIAALLAMPAAHADSTMIAYGQMYGGSLIADTSLHVIGSEQLPAGKLTVQVNDLGVPLTIMDRLKSLTFNITNSTGVFASHVGDGSIVLDLPAPDFYTLHIIGIPADQFKLGALSWNAYFEPLAPVPLPAGVWLLVTGAAWAIGLQRRRAKLATQESGPLFLRGVAPLPGY